MEEWDEVCLICGITTKTPTVHSVASTVDHIMGELASLYPSSFKIASYNVPRYRHIKTRLTTAVEIFVDVSSRRRKFFEKCCLIGHFQESYKYDVPWRLKRVSLDTDGTGDLTQSFTRLVLPGRGVQARPAKSVQESGDFILSPEDHQEFAAIPNDPNDRDLNDHRPLNHIVHPPEAYRGFEDSHDKTFKTSSAPYSYVCVSYMAMDSLDYLPWEGFGNFWVTRGCFDLLKAWVCLPPVQNGLYCAEGEEPLKFEEEFYEVLNSRNRGRTSGLGTWAEMEYMGVSGLHAFSQANDDFFFEDLKEVAEILEGEGDDSDLVNAIIRSTRYRQYCPPQTWPTKADWQAMSHQPPPSIPIRVLTATRCPILSLPVEALEVVLTHLSDVREYIALSQTCTLLHNTLLNPQRFNYIFRSMSKDSGGWLFWIRPLRKELMGRGPGNSRFPAALGDLEEWVGLKAVEDDSESGDRVKRLVEAFDNPDFDWAPFVKACGASDSMMNRRRIWKQVKQIEKIWVDYRLNGWQVNRFITKDQGIRAK